MLLINRLCLIGILFIISWFILWGKDKKKKWNFQIFRHFFKNKRQKIWCQAVERLRELTGFTIGYACGGCLPREQGFPECFSWLFHSQRIQYKVNKRIWKVNWFRTRSTFSGKESTESGKTVNLFRCHSQRFNVYSLIILNIISATKGVSTTLKAQKIRNDFQLKLLSSATIR